MGETWVWKVIVQDLFNLTRAICIRDRRNYDLDDLFWWFWGRCIWEQMRLRYLHPFQSPRWVSGVANPQSSQGIWVPKGEEKRRWMRSPCHCMSRRVLWIIILKSRKSAWFVGYILSIMQSIAVLRCGVNSFLQTRWIYQDAFFWVRERFQAKKLDHFSLFQYRWGSGRYTQKYVPLAGYLAHLTSPHTWTETAVYHNHRKDIKTNSRAGRSPQVVPNPYLGFWSVSITDFCERNKGGEGRRWPLVCSKGIYMRFDWRERTWISNQTFDKPCFSVSPFNSSSAWREENRNATICQLTLEEKAMFLWILRAWDACTSRAISLIFAVVKLGYLEKRGNVSFDIHNS